MADATLAGRRGGFPFVLATAFLDAAGIGIDVAHGFSNFIHHHRQGGKIKDTFQLPNDRLLFHHVVKSCWNPKTSPLYVYRDSQDA